MALLVKNETLYLDGIFALLQSTEGYFFDLRLLFPGPTMIT